MRLRAHLCTFSAYEIGTEQLSLSGRASALDEPSPRDGGTQRENCVSPRGTLNALNDGEAMRRVRCVPHNDEDAYEIMLPEFRDKFVELCWPEHWCALPV